MSMTKQQKEIAALEKEFWDSIVDGKPEVATGILTEPAVMVSSHGATKFDHATYTKMAKDEQYKLVSYKMSDMDVVFPAENVAVATYHVTQKMEMKGKPMQMDVFDSSTWVNVDGKWRCAIHTESQEHKKVALAA